MKKTTILVIEISTFLCIFSFLFISASGEEITKPTLYVGGSGPGNYTRIQDALDNATTGGTVHVFSGTYHEHIRITTSVHLIGENKDSTVIDGDNEEYVIILDADNSTLSGFTITHSGRTFPKAGVLVTSDGNSISGNILTANYYGMRLESAQYNMIVSNEIIKNLRCGVYFSKASHNVLTGNIVSNHSFNGFGLYEFSNNNTILENILSHNNYSGVNIRDSLDNRIIDNRFIGDHVGLHVPLPEYSTVFDGNAFSENRLDLEEEKDPMVMIGAGFTVFLIVVFLILRNRNT
jgi:parallel beta-helix repeat protein